MDKLHMARIDPVIIRHSGCIANNNNNRVPSRGTECSLVLHDIILPAFPIIVESEVQL